MADLSQMSTEELMALREQAVKQQSLAKVPTSELMKARDAIAKSGKPIGIMDATLTGFAEGASLGGLDEFSGFLEAVGSKIGFRGVGGSSLSDIRRETPLEDQQSFSEVYEQGRDIKRQGVKEARAQQPLAFGTGRFAGAVAGSAAFPGSSTIRGATSLGLLEGALTSEAKVGSNQFIRDTGISGLTTGGFQAGLSTVGAAIKAKPKADAKGITEAAQQIGVTPTPGMVYDDAGVQVRESVLAQSTGKLGGQGLRKTIEGNKKAVQETAEAIVKDASAKTGMEAGQQLEKELTESVAQKLAPAEEIYNAYEKRFRLFKPKTKAVGEFIDNLKTEVKFSDSALRILDDFGGKVSKVNNLDDLKSLRTTVYREAKKAARAGDGDASYVLNKLYGRLTEARSEALLSRAQSMGGTFFQQAKKDIEAADAIYRQTAGEIENAVLKRGANMKLSPKKTVETFFKNTPEADRIAKVLRTNDPKQIEAIKKAFPKAFETARKQTIEEIGKRAEQGGVVNPRRLAKIVSEMQPESANLIFGKDAALKAKALKKVLDNIPAKVGASDTPRGLQAFRDVFSFEYWIDHMNSLSKSTIQSIVTDGGKARKVAENLARGAVLEINRSLIPESEPRQGLQIPRGP